jgi:hypothetical protein
VSAYFFGHSKANSAEAIALRDRLGCRGGNDLFLSAPLSLKVPASATAPATPPSYGKVAPDGGQHRTAVDAIG